MFIRLPELKSVVVSPIMFGLFETVNAIKMATFSFISLAHVSIELSLITIRPGESFEQSANIVDGLNR